jgi:hypothetical protein
MAKRREVQLSTAKRDELEFYRDHDEHPYVRERCAAMLKIADGNAPYHVALAGLLKPRDPDTVYEWLAHYQAEGVAGLIGHQQGGNHRRRLR